MTDDLKRYITTLAAHETNDDGEGFNAYEYSGGNYDEAYSMGVTDGEILLARRILEEIQ